MEVQTEVAHAIDELYLVDTHEHLTREQAWVESPRDILQDLFASYVPADLVVAGATPDAVERLLDPSAGDLESRLAGVRNAWGAVRHTGYGEAVRLIASEVYGLDELTLDGLARAQARLRGAPAPGGDAAPAPRDGQARPRADRRLHVGVPGGRCGARLLPLWLKFCNGVIEAEEILDETEIEVRSLEDLRAAMAAAQPAFQGPHRLLRGPFRNAGRPDSRREPVRPPRPLPGGALCAHAHRLPLHGRARRHRQALSERLGGHVLGVGDRSLQLARLRAALPARGSDQQALRLRRRHVLSDELRRLRSRCGGGLRERSRQKSGPET